MNINWNAEKYTADFSFVPEYGNDVLRLIDCNKAKSALDLGCGNGALTKKLYDLGMSVTGLDASEDFLKIARTNYPQIVFERADATNFTLSARVDVVFSNAVFHWIDKDRQRDMLACVHRALNTGGQFVFELGGHGNNRIIHEELKTVFEMHSVVYKMPFYFPTIGEYAALLEQSGFEVRHAVLFDRPTELKGSNGLRDWIRMFVKEPFTAVADPDKRDSITDMAVNRLRKCLYCGGKWYADYVRLRMKAIKL